MAKRSGLVQFLYTHGLGLFMRRPWPRLISLLSLSYILFYGPVLVAGPVRFLVALLLLQA
ncbi:hypothetical protein CC78DRAFT_219616 [Lojkania enalia]|uniref:Uncharacterized protein n=1 Tax=Lojkania enalia TaxID=147567 RepID=A0A9P4KER4_9PLEO|nr:hypothetical protein CC78DRAFT_219616 [Didymosphaeria enalia]